MSLPGNGVLGWAQQGWSDGFRSPAIQAPFLSCPQCGTSWYNVDAEPQPSFQPAGRRKGKGTAPSRPDLEVSVMGRGQWTVGRRTACWGDTGSRGLSTSPPSDVQLVGIVTALMGNGGTGLASSLPSQSSVLAPTTGEGRAWCHLQGQVPSCPQHTPAQAGTGEPTGMGPPPGPSMAGLPDPGPSHCPAPLLRNPQNHGRHSRFILQSCWWCGGQGGQPWAGCWPPRV